MPVISRPGAANPATPTTPAGGAGGAAPVQGVQPGAPAVADAPVPSAAGDLKPAPVVINGFGGKPLPKVNITLTPTAGQLGNKEARADLDEGGWVSRGYIDVRYQPSVGGVDIEIESRHSKPSDPAAYKGDEMAIYLQARVLDAGKERIITLGTLFDGVMNADGKSAAVRRFHVDYDEINAWLKSKSPHLQFVPGDPLAAWAVWKTAGHQWGGFMREGYFTSPAPLGKKSQVDVRTAPVGEAPQAVSVSDVEKPIDITHKLPDDMIKAYPLVLEDGGKLVSRREHETKFCPKSLDELKSVTLRLLDIAAASPKKREQALLEMFGKDEELSKARGFPVSGWKISTTDRYYAKDADGKVLKNAEGLPVVVPMFDVYQDDAAAGFPFASQNMAVRFRDGEIKAGENVGSMGKLNMKTPRVSDPFSLIQTGLELSLDTKPGISKNAAAMAQLGELLDKGPAPYNPMIEQRKVSYQLKGKNALESAVDNLANRYKFTLEHESGMEIEISMDFVHAGFVFETKAVAATSAMSEEQKYDHYAALAAGDVLCSSGPLKQKHGEINTVVFDDGADGQSGLVMANFWLDESGNKRCSEHPAVRFPQVEMEMDHVQARSSGPVQGAYTKPTEVKNIENDADQDAFLTAVSEQATMNGPPTTHAWEDLKDHKLYSTSDYAALAEAVTDFRTHLFPNGVLEARQKAAQALELGGKIKKRDVTLSASMPSVSGRAVYMDIDWQNRNTIKVNGAGTVHKPTTATIAWDGFPIRIPLTGAETAKDVATKIAEVLDKAVLYKAVMTETAPGQFSVVVSER